MNKKNIITATLLSFGMMALAVAPFSVIAQNIASISPTIASVGGSGFTLTVSGSGFVSGSTVRVDGNNRNTTYVSSTQLTASIPSSDLQEEKSLSITVANPDGQTSNATTFTVFAPGFPDAGIEPSASNVFNIVALVAAIAAGFMVLGLSVYAIHRKLISEKVK